MPGRKGKFRTLHKFGKRRRRGKRGEGSGISQGIGLVVEESTTPESTPSMSSATETVASARKEHIETNRQQKSSDEKIVSRPRRKKSERQQGGIKLEGVPSSNLNVIIDLNCLQPLVTNLHCPRCRKPTLRVNEGGPELRRGLACLLELDCLECGRLSSTYTTSADYDVDNRTVTAASESGMSSSQLKLFLEMMGFPPLLLNEKEPSKP